jgi:hypothetical protein
LKPANDSALATGVAMHIAVALRFPEEEREGPWPAEIIGKNCSPPGGIDQARGERRV